MRGFVVACAGSLLACPSPTERSQIPAPTVATPTAVSEAEPAPDPEPGPEMRLLVGGKAGLHEFDLDGGLLRTLMSEPCRAPRVLPNGEILFLRWTEALEHELVLRATDGELRAVASLPVFYEIDSCKVVAADCDRCVYLDLYYAEEFAIDPGKNEVCLSLQDRNDNMASVGLVVTIDLASGKLAHTTEFSPCHGYLAWHSCGRLWPDPPEADPAASARDFPFDFVEEGRGPGAIVHAGREPITMCSRENENHCVGESVAMGLESPRSSSGRFALLDGRYDWGDLIHREQIIFDRLDGSLHALEQQGEGWKMIRVQPVEIMWESSERNWFAAVGESDERWLPGDRLWIDGLLMDLAARQVQDLQGDLALRLDGGL